MSISDPMTTDEAMTGVILAMRAESIARDAMVQAQSASSAASGQYQRASQLLEQAQYDLDKCLRETADSYKDRADKLTDWR